MPLKLSRLGDRLKNIQYHCLLINKSCLHQYPSSCSTDHHWLSALWFSAWCSPSGITHSRVTPWLSALCYYLFAKLCNLERYGVYLRRNRFTSTAVDKVVSEIKSVKLRMQLRKARCERLSQKWLHATRLSFSVLVFHQAPPCRTELTRKVQIS